VKKRRFKLVNTGVDRVTVKHINPVPDLYELTGDIPIELAVGQSVEFGVRLADSSEGPRAGWLEFELKTKTQKEALTAVIAGNLTGPIFSLLEAKNANAFDFGRVPQSGVAKHVFSILSSGVEPLEVQVAEVTGPFRLTRHIDHPVLRTEQWARFEIQAICTTPGPKRGSMRADHVK